MRTLNPTATAVAAILPVLLLAGCSQAAPEAPAETKQEAPAKAETPAAPEEKAPASTEAGDRPDWAVNPIDVGELVGETKGTGWDIKVYRLGNATTTSDGTWAMPDTKAPVMPAGTEMTVYNVVFTNISDADVLLEEGMSVTLNHTGVEDYKAVLSSSDDPVYEQYGVKKYAYDFMKIDEVTKYGDNRGYIVVPGQSFAIGSNTWAVPGEIKVEAYANVMDESGKRLPEASEIVSLNITQ